MFVIATPCWRSLCTTNASVFHLRPRYHRLVTFLTQNVTVRSLSIKEDRLGRSFSSSQTTVPTSQKNTIKPLVLPLYKRDEDRILKPRLALGLSALNTTYWLWYTLDFIPAVNASLMENLHIDPNVGWGALGLGIVINAITAIYPSLLISRLDYDPIHNHLLVYRHQLPILTQSTKATSYELGDLTIDPTDAELKKILGDMKGDWIKYKGHLALKRKGEFIPLLMEVQNGREEVKDGEALLQAMLRPMVFSASQTATNHKKKPTGSRIKSKANKKRIK